MISLKLFPKILGVFVNQDNKIIKNNLINKCYSFDISKNENWISKINNSNGLLNLYDIKDFKNLLNWIDTQVSEYCKNLKINPSLKNKYAWFNIYKKYDFQEYHSHPDSNISAIYYLSGDTNSAKTYFIDFEGQKMDYKFNINNYTEDNSSSWDMPFEEGKLIVFRSDMFHCVEKHNLNTDRISLAINYY